MSFRIQYVIRSETFLWHRLQQKRHMGSGTERWKQKWPYIYRHNVHHGHCRTVGPSPIRGHTLERGTAKVPLNYKFWLPPAHFRLFLIRSQGIKRRDTTPSGVTDT